MEGRRDVPPSRGSRSARSAARRRLWGLGDVVRELRLAIWLRGTYGRFRTAFYPGTDSGSGDRHLGESVCRWLLVVNSLRDPGWTGERIL